MATPRLTGGDTAPGFRVKPSGAGRRRQAGGEGKRTWFVAEFWRIQLRTSRGSGPSSGWAPHRPTSSESTADPTLAEHGGPGYVVGVRRPVCVRALVSPAGGPF